MGKTTENISITFLVFSFNSFLRLMRIKTNTASKKISPITNAKDTTNPINLIMRGRGSSAKKRTQQKWEAALLLLL
ncbi:MAG: hypothetical protein K6G47_05245 [Clostridia bacterium]|nr:hypothetical protein [Clostridia bacterium]